MNTETNTAASTTTKASKGPGRPKAELKYPRGAFTFTELFELNRGDGKKDNVCQLTVRNHIKAQLSAGFLVKLHENVETGKPGQPAHRYIRAAVRNAALARAAARAGSAPETSAKVPEVVDVSLAETPAVESAPAVEVPATA